jgi:hypothetical protein
MPEVPYVSETAAEKARELESRFLTLPPEAGVLFVAIHAVPALGGKTEEFDVRLGISRQFEEGTGLAIIKKVLEDDLASGDIRVSAAVYRGVRGAGCDEDSSRSHQPAS